MSTTCLVVTVTFQPTLTITDTTGSGAAATATVAHINTLNRGQEVYNFADVDLTQFPGLIRVLGYNQSNA